MIDIHNHMLPGMDDGPSRMDESVEMAKVAVDDGVTEVVCTPHWCAGRNEHFRRRVLDGIALLKDRLNVEGIPLEIHPGAELLIDVSIPVLLEKDELMTYDDAGRYILLELPQLMLPENIDDFLWDLNVRKITPIIAHVERNTWLRHHPEKVFEWVSMGIPTQVTAASVVGKFGKEIKAFSHFLIENEMAHVLATDAHGARGRRPELAEGYEMLEKLFGIERARRMVYENPKMILDGSPLPLEEPTPPEARATGRWRRLKSFFLNSFLLLLLPGVLACSSDPMVRKVEPAGIREITHGRYRPVKEEVLVKVVGLGETSVSAATLTGNETMIERVEFAGDTAANTVNKIKARNLESPPPSMRSIPLAYKAYIREKFKGKRVVFPEEIGKTASRREQVYTIGVEDELLVAVWKNPDLSMAVVVGDDGKVSIPLVGELKVQGLQISEMAALLTRKLSRFVEAPQVSVNIKTINSRRVFITGAVASTQRPGEPVASGVTLRGDRRLLTSLSEVTIADDADLEEAYIVRGDVVIPLDLHGLVSRGDMTQNILLQPLDTIVIPARRKEISVLGEVQKPGQYKMKNRTTVLDAISAASGIKGDGADLERAYIARQGRNYPLNLKKLFSGDSRLNVILENKDVVYIPGDKDNKVFVLGEVGRPSVVKFTDSMDVLEAIARAGDFLYSANREQVVVVRGPRENAEVYAIDALKMSRGYRHEKFILKKSDVLFVPRTYIADWNIFITQLLPSASMTNSLKNLGN